MRSKLLILAFALTLVAAACNKQPDTAITPTPTPTPTDAPTPTPTPNPSPVTISITSTGFSPSTITVKKGTTVTFKNDDSKGRWPASNPHPTHTDLPGFDAGKALAAGGTYSFTFTKVGTWGFHDHLFTSQSGKVIVTE